MRSSGEKNVKWFVYKGALIELTNTSPGVLDIEGRPWMFVTVTFNRSCVGGNMFGIDLLFPSASISKDVVSGKEYRTWSNQWIQQCAIDANVPYIGDIYVNQDVAKYTWDYMHLWHDKTSYTAWGMHGMRFVVSVITGLDNNGVTYFTECMLCHKSMPVRDIATIDRNDDLFGVSFHQMCYDSIVEKRAQSKDTGE